MSEQPSIPPPPMHSWVVCRHCGAVIADLPLHLTRCAPTEPEPTDPEPTPEEP